MGETLEEVGESAENSEEEFRGVVAKTLERWVGGAMGDYEYLREGMR